MKVFVLQLIVLSVCGAATAQVNKSADAAAVEKKAGNLKAEILSDKTKKSEEYAIIAPNGAPILASSVPGHWTIFSFFF